MELSTVIFIGLLVCVVKDVHAVSKRRALARRLSLIEKEMKAWKGTVVDIEDRIFDKFDEVDSMKVNIQTTKTRLKAITQQLTRVERERNTYRDDLEKVLKELTVTRRDIRALERDVKHLNTSCVMRTETVPGSTTASTDPSLSMTVPLEDDSSTSDSDDSDQHASPDPSQDRTPSTTVPPVTVTTQDPDQRASTDPSLSTTVPPVTVTTQDSHQHATPSAAANRDLWDASIRGDLETVRRIVAAGHVDVNHRGRYSRTPVMRAAWKGHRDVVKFLVGEGADLSLVDMNGDNILHFACVGGDLETVKLIVSLNVVDVNSRGRGSRTPVMEAARMGRRDVVEFLVGEGADPSLVDMVGNNALHWACWGVGQLETVKLIVSLDVVDVNAKNNPRETAADLARVRGNSRVLGLLVSRGGTLSWW